MLKKLGYRSIVPQHVMHVLLFSYIQKRIITIGKHKLGRVFICHSNDESWSRYQCQTPLSAIKYEKYLLTMLLFK